MSALLVAVVAGYGVYLLFTARVFRWDGIGFGPQVTARRSTRDRAAELFAQAGLSGVEPRQIVAVSAALAIIGGAVAFALFGGVLPMLVAALFAATGPAASYRRRREARRNAARDAWPRMIEEMRLLTGSLGRSVPQALFEAGRRGPSELRPAFEAAHREWLISTDFARTTTVLKAALVDATADAACETLLVAHEVGGSELDRRLLALAEDRTLDLQGRKDAQAKQAGVRFARRFVLVVPLGMTLAGLSIGSGREAYATSLGQIAVATGLVLVAGCWAWAGRLLRLPEEERVFIR